MQAKLHFPMDVDVQRNPDGTVTLTPRFYKGQQVIRDLVHVRIEDKSGARSVEHLIQINSKSGGLRTTQREEEEPEFDRGPEAVDGEAA